MADGAPETRLIAPGSSPQEAAAIVAAIDRFELETAAQSVPVAQEPDPWTQAALLEGVDHWDLEAADQGSLPLLHRPADNLTG